MINILVGVHKGTLWKFHWDGKTRVPFSVEEMNKEKKEYKEECEKIAAKIYNRTFSSNIS